MMTQHFSPELQKKLDDKVALYETRRAAVLEVLRLIMEDKGFISLDDERAVAQYLGIAEIDVREVMTFYSLFYSKPRAKLRLNVCRTLSCHLLGADAILEHLHKKLGIKGGETPQDSQCSLNAVECLGACELAPMMQVNDDEYVGTLTIEKVDAILKKHKVS